MDVKAVLSKLTLNSDQNTKPPILIEKWLSTESHQITKQKKKNLSNQKSKNIMHIIKKIPRTPNILNYRTLYIKNTYSAIKLKSKKKRLLPLQCFLV